jgi:ferredoxin
LAEQILSASLVIERLLRIQRRTPELARRCRTNILLDFDRCILCELCVRASRDVDGKNVFAVGGHGIGTHLVVDAPSGRLGDTALSLDDMAAHICPVGAILPKRRGFAVPIGERPADRRARGDPPSGSQAPGGLACGSPAYEGSRDGAG